MREDVLTDIRGLNQDQLKLLYSIVEDSIFFGGVGQYHHGIARGDPPLYRKISAIQKCGLVTRRGYRYFPTALGVKLYFRHRDKHPTLD